MKKVLISLALITGLLAGCKSQTIKDRDGNYHVVVNAPDSSGSKKSKSVLTTNYFEDKDGQKYPVYRGSRGGLYYMKNNAEGVPTKRYLKRS